MPSAGFGGRSGDSRWMRLGQGFGGLARTAFLAIGEGSPSIPAHPFSMRLRSFQGLIPTPDKAAQVAAVPYDVVNRAESKALGAHNSLNLIHVDRAEIDLPDEVGDYDERVYAKARDNFLKLQHDGVLVREAAPCLYLYRQVMGKHSQTGLVGACHVED